MNLFLGGDFAQYVSIPVGSVVLLINPSIIPSKDGSQKIALSIHSSQYIKNIGKALDYGVCCGMQRNGNKCSNAVNLEISKYCMYHIRKTQEDISALRCDVNAQSYKHNVQANNLSEGRFHVDHEVIDCRPLQSSSQIDLTKLSVFRSKSTNGYMASRLIEKASEEEKKRKNNERLLELKKRRELELKENTPVLGRGMLPGNVIRLSEDDARLSKIHSLKRRLEDIQEAKQAQVPSTGNSVFDALLQSSKDLDTMKKTALTKEGAYAGAAIQDKLRVLKEREEMLERKEQARLEMMSMEIHCFWCANCKKYVENGIGREFCESQGHFLERRKEVKRMFECQECHSRTAFIGTELPAKPCACGGYIWKPCSFYQERNVKMETLKITAPNIHVLYCHDVKSFVC